MNQKTSPFHLELRTKAGAFVTDVAEPDAPTMRRAFAAIAHRSGPQVYGPHGTHRLVIPASKRPLFEPDEKAWAASAARRKAGV